MVFKCMTSGEGRGVGSDGAWIIERRSGELAVHQIASQHVRFKERYNGRDLIARGASGSSDRDPTAPLIRSDGCDLTKTVHDGPFHRNRRSFRLNGYAQIPYK